MESMWLTWGFNLARDVGLPAVITFIIVVIIWMFFRERAKAARKINHSDMHHREDVSRILSQYKEDVTEIKRLYENNVRLVDDFSKTYNRLETLYSETLAVVSLNTQTQTRLVEKITTNMFCPVVREKGPVSGG